MRVAVVTPPGPLVELDLAKQHLRVDGDAEDALIELYVAAASGHIDGLTAYLGRPVGEQVLECAFDQFPACGGLALPGAPVLSIVSIKIKDPSGGEQTLATEDYRLVDDVVLPPIGAAFPAVAGTVGSVRVRWRAGYASTPSAIAAAVLLITGDLYKVRDFEVTVSNTVENLLRPYRVLDV
jgi:uncharacterized phiE125 gp8 family phage protein